MHRLIQRVFQPAPDMNMCLLQALSGFNRQRESSCEFVVGFFFLFCSAEASHNLNSKLDRYFQTMSR